MQQQPTANSMNMAQMSPWGSGSPVPEETAMSRTEHVQPAVAARGGQVNIRAWHFNQIWFLFPAASTGNLDSTRLSGSSMPVYATSAL